MERLSTDILIELGFEKLNGLRWGYKGFIGMFSNVALDGIPRFYLCDFNPAIEFKDDLKFIKRMIDSKPNTHEYDLE